MHRDMSPISNEQYEVLEEESPHLFNGRSGGPAVEASGRKLKINHTEVVVVSSPKKK